jgi:hypothetical protein
VRRSAFFDVVREEIGWDAEAADGSLPAAIEGIF